MEASGGTHSPRTAFAFQAAAVALKAKVGSLRFGDRLRLLTSALEWVHEDEEARVAVLDFEVRCANDPAQAGEGLLQFLDRWAKDSAPRAAETVLGEMQEEFAGFDWQQRADLR